MKRTAQLLAGALLLILLFWGSMIAWDRWDRYRQSTRDYLPAPPGMVLVPAGEFLMGSDHPEAAPDERPLRKIYLPAFYIDQFEVTNRQFKKFKKDHQYPPEAEDLPVTFVLKSEAEAYCRFVGKRLPSGAEWEKAARGTDGRRYPWGNAFNPAYGNFRSEHSAESMESAGSHSLTGCVTDRGKRAVGSFPQGASPYGCQDMSGNVWEWVSDIWMDKNWLGLRSGYKRGILRGGAYSYSPKLARTSYQAFEDLGATCHDVGFRCAMDAGK